MPIHPNRYERNDDIALPNPKYPIYKACRFGLIDDLLIFELCINIVNRYLIAIKTDIR